MPPSKRWVRSGSGTSRSRVPRSGGVRASTRATSVVPAGGEPEPYGAQWWTNDAGDGTPLRLPGIPADAYWASGHDGQYIVVVPSADLVVVRTGFSPGGSIGALGIEDLVGDLTRAVG